MALGSIDKVLMVLMMLGPMQSNCLLVQQRPMRALLQQDNKLAENYKYVNDHKQFDELLAPEEEQENDLKITSLIDNNLMESKILKELYRSPECTPNELDDWPTALHGIAMKETFEKDADGMDYDETNQRWRRNYNKRPDEVMTAMKRISTNAPPLIGCDCKIKNEVIDLGQTHYPRYLLNAVCQSDQSTTEHHQKCRRGSYCKPLDYKVNVLTFRTTSVLEHRPKDQHALSLWLPDDLRQVWKFKTVTVAAGCFCSY